MRFLKWFSEIESQLYFHKTFDVINEVYNTSKNSIRVTKTNYYIGDYTLKYTVDDTSYVFISKDDGNGRWVIGFEREDMPGKYEPIGSTKYSGEVIVGLLKSIKILISNKKVESYIFNTNDIKLKRFYNKMIKYFERETKFKLTDIIEKGSTTTWVYTK